MIAHTDRVERRWLERRAIAHGLLAFAFLVCAMLIVCPPTREGFYPVCPIYKYLHIECPGCGATRALAALLHGRVAEAWRLNSLFVLLLPFAVAGAGECYLRAVRAAEFHWPSMPDKALYALLLATVAFTAARNMTH